MCQFFVFLGLSVLELGPMYVTDRRQTKASLNASALWERRHNNMCYYTLRMAVQYVAVCGEKNKFRIKMST